MYTSLAPVAGYVVTFGPTLLEPILLTCLEGNPIDFRSVDERQVRRARAAIRRVTNSCGVGLRDPINRNDFLCACGDLTEHMLAEHLIVGCGYRHGRTTRIGHVFHEVGQQRSVVVPDYLSAEIRRHNSHRSDAEVVVFHNHPRTGDEPPWFLALKSLLHDLPIASNADRRVLQGHAFNVTGILRLVLGQGRILFFLGESGFVKEFRLPPLMHFLRQDE
jgi:hypothetical protein